MKIDSLAFQTDLYFHRFTGVVLEYEDYLVVKTPTNPTFFWGNLLYFKNPPNDLSIKKWQQIFYQQFKTMNVQHMTLAWDSTIGEEGEASLFLADGFNLEKSSIMLADKIERPDKINDQLIIRPIMNEIDWEKVLQNHVECRASHFNENLYRKFADKRIADYRLMIKEGMGVWMGAFLGDKLIGDLGFFFQNGLGRFQVVGTHPDFRRIGVCSTLLYKTCLFALENLNIKKLVIVADPDYHAIKVYESVGFKKHQIQIGLCKFNKEVWST